MSQTATNTPTPRRTFLHLLACITIAYGVALGRVWAIGPRHRRGVARREIQLDLERMDDHIRILGAWFRRARRRPRWTRREQMLILEQGDAYGLSTAELARDFFLSQATVRRWKLRRSRAAAGLARPAPSIPIPPCRRICDSTRAKVQEMGPSFQGNRTISRHLESQGQKVSARSAGRFRFEAPAHTSPHRTAARPVGKEPPDILDLYSRPIASTQSYQPRLARMLNDLAEAFTEGIASQTWEEADGDLHDQRALLRTRRIRQLDLLLPRLARIPVHQRPHYTAGERAHILAFKFRFRLSHRMLGRWFLVDPNTISSWMRDLDGLGPEARKHPLVEPLPDDSSALTAARGELPKVPRRLGQAVEQTLARLAARVPRRRWPYRKPSGTARSAPKPRRKSSRCLPPLRARYPNHFWGSDLTTLELRRPFWLAAIVDFYSRRILAWGLFPRQPTSAAIEALFQEAVGRFGAPRHFVSDQGKQFRGALAKALGHHRVDQHHGAIGQHGAIAIVERMWRSVKDALLLQRIRPHVGEILHARISVIALVLQHQAPTPRPGQRHPRPALPGRSRRRRDRTARTPWMAGTALSTFASGHPLRFPRRTPVALPRTDGPLGTSPAGLRGATAVLAATPTRRWFDADPFVRLPVRRTPGGDCARGLLGWVDDVSRGDGQPWSDRGWSLVRRFQGSVGGHPGRHESHNRGGRAASKPRPALGLVVRGAGSGGDRPGRHGAVCERVPIHVPATDLPVWALPIQCRFPKQHV